MTRTTPLRTLVGGASLAFLASRAVFAGEWCRKPPLLALSGKNGAFFLPASVAYQRDDRNAEVDSDDARDLALTIEHDAIGARIMRLIAKVLP